MINLSDKLLCVNLPLITIIFRAGGNVGCPECCPDGTLRSLWNFRSHRFAPTCTRLLVVRTTHLLRRPGRGTSMPPIALRPAYTLTKVCLIALPKQDALSRDALHTLHWATTSGPESRRAGWTCQAHFCPNSFLFTPTLSLHPSKCSRRA